MTPPKVRDIGQSRGKMRTKEVPSLLGSLLYWRSLKSSWATEVKDENKNRGVQVSLSRGAGVWISQPRPRVKSGFLLGILASHPSLPYDGWILGLWNNNGARLYPLAFQRQALGCWNCHLRTSTVKTTVRVHQEWILRDTQQKAP